MLNRLFRHRKNHPQYLPARQIKSSCIPGLISVVLPVYNGAEYLSEAISSLLAQTYKKWELILVDDGSADNSASIAEEFAVRDSRIQIIRQENQKLPRALNHGFRRASGEFFTWLSADNRMLPNCLESMFRYLQQNPHADMVTGNMFLIDSAGKRLCGHGWFEFPPGSGNVILPSSTAMLNRVANNTIGAAFLYRRGTDAVLGGYSPRQFLLEDYDYFMRLNSLFHIHHLPDPTPIYAYRMHPNSLTAHDRELGITASRPKLMAFDARRRKFYQTRLYVQTDCRSPLLHTALAEAGLHPIAPGEKRGFSSDHIGKVLRLTTAVPQNRPDAIPCYLLSASPRLSLLPLPWKGTDADNGISGPFFFENLADLARFLRLRAACDLLRAEEEQRFSENAEI